ncbi:MAG: hypothetical protein KY467_07645 [Gemmatimonadetes bacterium]|nr:hypothetical protein [Gemmatimonadota bacterium]
MHRPSLLIPVTAAALVAACAPDRPADEPSAAEEAAFEEDAYVPPQLTPAESAAAVAKVQADADAATRRVMGPDYRPPAEPFVDTPEKQYASCMAQARSVEEPVRSTILQACERFRTRQQ